MRARTGLGSRLGAWAGLATALLLAFACGGEESAGRSADPAPEYVEAGDLPALRERGALRILTPPLRPRMLRHRSFPVDLELEIARDLARRLELEPVVIYRPREELLDALRRGEGDLVAARVKVPPQPARELLFSIPLDHVREMVVVPSEMADEISSWEDLEGWTFTLPADVETVAMRRRLADYLDQFELARAPEGEDAEQVVYGVSEGRWRATIADEDLIESFQRYENGVEAVLALTLDRPVAWALRPDGRELKEAADRFLQQTALTADLAGPLFGDLDAIAERKVLRVLTRNSPATYFLYRGQQLGFEYELARRFARSLGLRLQVVVKREAGSLIPALLAGEGDLIASSLAITPDRRRQLAFTRSYNRASELAVVRSGEGVDLSSPEDLAGRRIPAHVASAHRESLEALAGRRGFEIVDLAADVETVDLIDQLAGGTHDLIIVDSNELDIEMSHRDDVEAVFPLGPPREIAWAVRPGDDRLLAAANRFLERQRRDLALAELKQKYFGDRERVRRRVAALAADEGQLSPFDPLFRSYGGQREIDWRLITAQAFQESRFDPGARSWAGAIGLMQIMPRTARHMGERGDLREPEVSVRTGTKYLRWLIERYEPSLPLAERLRFALASYNAGRGHVLDGRRLAEEMGRDPDVWFDNVEEVIPLLSQRPYSQRARYGYCRCQETVDYVRRISDHYQAYIQAMD